MGKYLEVTSKKSAKTSRLATVISKITNPCVLSIVMLTAVLFTGTNSGMILARSVIALVLFLVILPLVYVYLRILRKHEKVNLNNDPTLFLKRHPLDIIILEAFCGIPCLLTLYILDAPEFTLITLVDLLAITFIVALINLRYRVSFHLAAIVVLLYLTIVIWGLQWMWLIPLIPITAWAKYKLHDHSLFQMIYGITIAIIVTSITLFLFFLR